MITQKTISGDQPAPFKPLCEVTGYREQLIYERTIGFACFFEYFLARVLKMLHIFILLVSLPICVCEGIETVNKLV